MTQEQAAAKPHQRAASYEIGQVVFAVAPMIDWTGVVKSDH